MPKPWNRWLHCILGTYGSWLPGDPRGFRTRHHREHVEGDSRNPPPPGLYEHRHEHARELMRHPPMLLAPAHRVLVCRALARTLLEYTVELVDLSVGGQHVHVLCRFPQQLPPHPDGRPRRPPGNLRTNGPYAIAGHILGRAKRAASVQMNRQAGKPQGRPLWARRPALKPIADRGHQLAVVRYIRNHAADGAAVWSRIR